MTSKFFGSTGNYSNFFGSVAAYLFFEFSLIGVNYVNRRVFRKQNMFPDNISNFLNFGF